MQLKPVELGSVRLTNGSFEARAQDQTLLVPPPQCDKIYKCPKKDILALKTDDSMVMAGAAAPLALSLWLPLNGTLAVRHANLSTTAVTVNGPAVSFVAASNDVGGQAALLAAATKLSVPAPCVLPWATATVMGWWRLTDGVTANELLRVGNQELAVTGLAGKPKTLCLMSGGVDVGGWKWDYLCKACPGLLASEWTHLAITWDAAGNQQLFANGTLLGTQASKHTPSQPWGVRDLLTLGSGTVVSQLTVWADVLKVSTIAAAAATPQAFDEQLDAATPEPHSSN